MPPYWLLMKCNNLAKSRQVESFLAACLSMQDGASGCSAAKAFRRRLLSFDCVAMIQTAARAPGNHEQTGGNEKRVG